MAGWNARPLWIFLIFLLLSAASYLLGSHMLLITSLFFLGLVIVIKGADFLVEGASAMARQMGVSPLVIGLTIVAFGTSLPEFTVSVIAALEGFRDISVGNIVGSNIANIGLVLGISGLVAAMAVRKSTVKFETPYMIAGSVLLVLLSMGTPDFAGRPFLLGQVDGLILLLVFGIFMTYMLQSAKHQHKDHLKELMGGQKPERNSRWKGAAMVLAGIAGTIAGAKLLVDNGASMARSFGVSEAFIGLTLVAVGTSVPELVTSVVAAKKKLADIAVGDIIGSNIFNALFILGVAAMVAPLEVSRQIVFSDMMVMLYFAFILQIFMLNGKINRWNGGVLLGSYIVYIGYLSIISIPI
ncbi:MAG: calcium/sodium antiporter [Candidatus Aenigmarchaeota archaeon]|nr:calcium/sodium antiporter [Candidatus Aenigmarchaeota archaeon]